MQPTTGYARLGDERIAYQIFGDGPIDIVNTIGSWGSFDVDWAEPTVRAYWQQIARFARVIRFDQRGSGASDPLPLDALPPWESVADEMELVLDAVGSEQAVVMVAGGAGPLGALFAATRPERTTALVIFHASARYMADDDYPFGIPANVQAELSDNFVEAWGSGELSDLLFPSMAGDPEFRQVFGRWQRAAASPAAVRRYMDVEASADARAILPSITAPTLILHAMESPMLPIEHGRYLAEHIPNATLVELPGGDAAPYWDHPEISIAALREFISDILPASQPERQLATVMFTDIVDSTRKAEELGDRRWQALLDRHNEIAKTAVQDQSGHYVRSTGDGILATFIGPGRAIVGATRLQSEIAKIDLHLRTGIHTGEIEISATDVGGIAVHLAARIMAQATADEILVSRTVKDLVVGSDLAFEDRGTHTLKGIDDPWHLYAVST